MNKVALLLCAVLATVMMTGCPDGKDSSSSQASGGGVGVAVVDIDRVANEVGARYQYLSNLNSLRQDAEQKLQQLRTRLAEEVKKLEDELKKETDEAKKEPMRVKMAEKEREFQTAIAIKQNELREYAAKMDMVFRSSLNPALKKVSDAHGGKVIILKNFTAYVPPGADVTDALIDELKTSQITLPATSEDRR